ncbi:MAG: hypothetical protein WAZ18_00840 [Alphaproteobacteria bacterium]
MKTIILAAVAALTLAACEPVHNIARQNTCAFAGIEGVDTRECATRGSGIYNLTKASPVVVWHNPRETIHMDKAAPVKHKHVKKKHKKHRRMAKVCK